MLKLDNKAKNLEKIFYNIKKRAFSLVELIIAIAILSILATIAFLSFGNYGSQTRDSVRRNDLGILLKSMSIYKTQKGVYPKVEQGDGVNVKDHETYEGWKETIVTEKMSSELQISKHLKDPLGIPYKYLFSVDGKYYVFEVDLENGEKLLVGNIPLSCANLKDNGQFQGTGLYNIFSDKFRPIEVFCHKDYRETFYREIIAGDMERIDLGVFPNDVNYTTEENATIGGKFSIKTVGSIAGILSNHFTYVDSSEKYSISGKFKTINPTGKPSQVFYGFSEYDEDFQYIGPERVDIVFNTQTELTRKVEEGTNIIYFKCNDNLFNTIRNNLASNLGYTLAVAYDVKEDLSDLPTKIVSDRITDQNKVGYNLNLPNLIKRESIDECSLVSKFNIPLLPVGSGDKEIGTKIRLHKYGSVFNYSGSFERDISNMGWTELSGIVNGELQYGTQLGKFRKGTKFIKIMFFGNYYAREEGGVMKYSNDNSTTYIDDLKLEIIK